MTKSTFEVLRWFEIHFYQDKTVKYQHFYQDKTIITFLIYFPIFTATSAHLNARSCQIAVNPQLHRIIFYFRIPNS